MAEEVWYYHHAGAQAGPVAWEKLQELAASGGLHPDDLVWKQGMPDWVPGRTIDGLFPEGATPPGPPPVPAGGPPPIQAPKVRKPINDARDVLPYIKLVELLLDFLRKVFSTALLDVIDKWAKIAGNVAYAGIAVIAALFLIIVAIKGAVIMLVGAILVIPLAVLLQYVALLFLDAGKTLIDKSPSDLSSPAFLDSFGLVAFVGALGAFCGGIVGASSGGGFMAFAAGFGLMLVLLYVGGAALNPDTVNVRVGARASAGEEAISILSFIMKLQLLRLIPFAFGVGAVVSLFAMFYFLIQSFTNEMAAMMATMAFPYIFGIALLPFAGYILFLLYYLIIDYVRAVLVVPGKLDILIAAGDEAGEADEADEKAKPKAKPKAKK